MQSRELTARIVWGLLCMLGLVGQACRAPEHVPIQTEVRERTIQSLITSGRYSDAQTSAEELLRLVENRSSTAPAEDLATALDMLVEARWKNGDASPDTQSKAERAVRLRRTLSNDPDTAKSLRLFGQVLLLSGRPNQALECFQEGLGTLERSIGSGDLLVADALEALATGFVELNRFSEAGQHLERALKIRASPNSREGPAVAHTLDLLTLASLRAGRYGDARPPLERALNIRRNQPDHPEEATTFALHGDLLWFEGRVTAARDAYQQCVSIAEALLRLNHPNTAHCTRRLGLMLVSLGDISGALTLFERATEMAERSLGSEHPFFSGYLNDLAEAHRTLMDFRRARSLYERALALRERVLGNSHADVATIVYNLALVSSDLADFPEARRQFDRAISIWQARLGADHPFVALATASLAQMLLRNGREEEALALQRRVLAIREHSLVPNHRDTADALGDLASTLLARGRIVEAARLSDRAIGIWEGAGVPDSPGFATALALRGNVLAVSGDLNGAREHYTTASGINERVLGADHPASADLRVRLASVSAQAGQRELALEQALAGEDGSRRFLLLALRYLPEREALSYAVQRPTGLNIALSLVASNRMPPAAVEATFDVLVKSRAVIFDEIATRRQAVGAAQEPDLAALRTAWVSARQRLANLSVRTGHSPSPTQIALLAETRREAERSERALAERSATFRAERARPAVGLGEIKAALPQRSALVAFARYDRAVDIKSTVLGSRQAAPSYLAFVLGPAPGPPVVVPLGAAGQVDAAIAEWRRQVTRALHSTSPAIERDFRVTGNRLRARIWDPLERHLRGSERIFVVPDGAFNLVNFSALPVGPSDYLIDRGPVIHYLTAERDLVQPALSPSSTARGLLALGGVAFDESSSPEAPRAGPSTDLRASCGSFQSARFAPLPATLGEVQDVADGWRTQDRQPAPAVRVMTGPAASEPAFKSQAPGHRVLHLATHGFFLGDCEASTTGTRSVGGLVGGAAASGRVTNGDSPLLQTGLALAGANRRAQTKPNDDDGILTAEEVASLNLDGTEWAVLSACDTGLGEIRAGEGVFGLRRAFQIAGARTVIMSLWSVEDQSTREWMKALYDGRLRRRIDTAAAVREAGLAVLKARRAKGQTTHPFYWAAFVAAGDWR